MIKLRLMLFAASLLSLPLQAQEPIAPQQAKLVGINLMQADKQTVRQHLRAIGGFQQERATFDHPNLDKFFPVSNLRDSYYIEFRYDANGQVVSAKRLYRRSALRVNNDYRDLSTEDIARQLIPIYGQPDQVQRKVSDGFASYPSFVWRDNEMTIRIDRKGSDRYSPVFIEYQLARDPFVEKEEPDNLAQNF